MVVFIACACTPSNESLKLVTLSVNILSIHDVYTLLVPTLKDSDKTEVHLGSSWIISKRNSVSQFGLLIL